MKFALIIDVILFSHVNKWEMKLNNLSLSIVNDTIFQSYKLDGVSLSEFEKYLNDNNSSHILSKIINISVSLFAASKKTDEEYLDSFIKGLRERVKEGKIEKNFDFKTKIKIIGQVFRLQVGFAHKLGQQFKEKTLEANELTCSFSLWAFSE